MSFNRKTIKKMLPKAYLRKLVADQIYVAITCFRNLVPVMGKYVYNNGTTKNLMSLTGTIPIRHQGVIYNIPLILWIEQNFPQSAPICYINPTKEMMVVTGKFIRNSGEIWLPYLDEWKSGECDLVSLLQVMAAVFGEFPPVHMRPEWEQSLCQQQHRQADESYYLSLARDDGHPFQNENETNC